MGGVYAERKPPFKKGGEYRRQGKGPHDDPEVRVAYAVSQAETLAFLLDQVDLQEFRITALSNVYRVMLKGIRYEKPVVAYFYADTWRDAFRLAMSSLDTANAGWVQDDHPLKKARYASDCPTPTRRLVF